MPTICLNPKDSDKNKTANIATNKGLIFDKGDIKDIFPCLTAFDANKIPMVAIKDTT